jgi:acetyl esterase/lipase
MRQASITPPIEEVIAGRPITYSDRTISSPEGDLTVAVFARTDHRAGGPGIFHTHGGGMIIGDRFDGIGTILDWVHEFDAVAVSVEYRLAPEHPDPAPIADCYAGLEWTAAHVAELGFDPDRLIIAGASAGGGLAAGVALKARDEHGPRLAAQVLIYPMLDDRNQTVSSQQINGMGYGIGAAMTPAGTRISETGARPTRYRFTPRRLGPPTCLPSRRPSSTSGRRRCSATRSWRTPLRSGPPEVSASCTSGVAAFTDSTCSPPRRSYPKP